MIVTVPWPPVDGNAFSPGFLEACSTVFNAVALPFAVHSLFRLLRRDNFGNFAPKSAGIVHLLRCVIVAAHLLLYVLKHSFAAVTLVFGLAIHIVEPTRSPIASTYLLAYRPVLLLLEAAWLYQSYVVPVSYAKAAFTLSLFVFVLEVQFWKPTHELLRHYKTEGLPLNEPNLIQQCTFTYMNPLISNAYKHLTVSHKDLPPMPEGLKSLNLMGKLDKEWSRKGQRSGKRHLTLALIKTFWPVALSSFTFELIDSLLGFVPPQLLRLLILFIGQRINTEVPMLKGVLITLAMLLVSLVQTFTTSRYVLKISELGFGCRSALSSLVFSKSLRLSHDSRSEKSTGDIVNLVSVDASRVQQCAMELSTLIIAPIELLICTYSLYHLVGKATLAGVAVIIIAVPLHSALVRVRKKYNKKQMALKDERNKITNELLVTIKSIKLYSWEQPMLERLLDVRNNKELRNLKIMRYISQAGLLIWVTMPFMVSFSTFATFALTSDTPLTADLVFPALTLLGILSRPMTQLPFLVNYISDASVALGRISAFLECPEYKLVLKKDESERSLHMHNASFLWKSPAFEEIAEDMDFPRAEYALRNITLSADKGDFICVVGIVGSGKSTLLSALLGHLESDTQILSNGRVAFCSQNPWIMNTTLRENVTFGLDFHKEFYDKTIEACQLLPDLTVLPDGDQTQVGEKGITLSGGQKARVALARAVYARADIYLLDDVLSAVDSHVGKNIIEQVFSRKGLLGSLTVVLATNNQPVLSCADRVYMLERGQFVETVEHGSTPEKVTELVGGFELSTAERSHVAAPAPAIAPFQFDPLKKNLVSKTGQIAETSQTGKVKWNVYLKYASACSGSGVVVWILFSVATNLSNVMSNYWLKEWAEKNSEIGDNSAALYFIAVYASIGLSTSLLNLAKGVLFWVFLGIRGGRVIHERMARRVFRAPMRFFDRTPVGRIINRFSNDVDKIDNNLPQLLSMLFETLMRTAMTLLIVSTAMPPFALVIVALGIGYSYFQRYYIAIQREMKRLVSVSRSPIFANLHECLTGVETIRAFDQVKRFTMINHACVDFNIRSLYMLRSVNRWLSIRLQTMSSVVVWAAALMILYKSTLASPIGTGLAGFVMTYALMVTLSLRMTVRMTGEVESNFVCVERCLEYCELPVEEEPGQSAKIPDGWPVEGTVALKNYSTRYADNLDLVLKQVSVSIAAGEKIGVVGRTGAGKLSLVLAIFRMIPAVEGHIEIDGVDTQTLALFDLRHSLGIIPQDSHMVDGSIRQNLDPFGAFSDEQLWRALASANLKETVLQLESGLDSKVSEGGSNFSAGQRQLMCLARALLNPSSVLILDEATAQVDVQTDKIVQATIRLEFAEKTIITIAHRLDTVMDSDKILSLDHGKVAEFGPPHELLKNPEGLFYRLCHR